MTGASLGRNLAASVLGNTWIALVQIAFIPVYIDLLGLEAYGLIGVYAFMQAALGILDMGLGPALSREAARASAGAQTVAVMRGLLRSVELVFLAVALAITAAMVTGSGWLVGRWLTLEALAPESVARALELMGILVALRLFAGPHRGVISGYQRLVWLNGVAAAFATLRGVGVIGVLAWYSPSIVAFFAFQCVVTFLEVALIARKAWTLLPSPSRAEFSAQALRGISRFSGGLALIMILYLVFSQADKVLLSTLVPLAAFGSYALASSVAGAVNLLVAPLGSVAYPRLSELAARGEPAAFVKAFHEFAQLMTLAVAPAAIVVSLFSHEALALWTGDRPLATETAPLLSALVIGAMFNAFMSMPYLLPIVRGRTRGLVAIHLLLVAVFVPVIYVGVSMSGARIAAYAVVGIHATALALAWPLMRDHLEPAERWKWLRADVLLPAVSALAAAALIRQLVHDGSIGEHGAVATAATIAAAYALALLAAAIALPISRNFIFSRA